MNEIFMKLMGNKIVKNIFYIFIAIVFMILLVVTVENLFSDIENIPRLKGIFAVIYLIFEFIGKFLGGVYNAGLFIAFIVWISFLTTLKKWLYSEKRNEEKADPFAMGGLLITLFIFSLWGKNFIENQKKIYSTNIENSILTEKYKQNKNYNSIYSLKFSQLDGISIDEAIILTNYEKTGYLPSNLILKKMGDKSYSLMLKIGKNKGFIK